MYLSDYQHIFIVFRYISFETNSHRSSVRRLFAAKGASYPKSAPAYRFSARRRSRQSGISRSIWA